ncbi:hypothetical protein [uncultured Winogradskyella sp.]|uniref:hypothetical protein n=1 Tax=uncultured Winogradskyella sp. TaxID=395353 RepID=UPI002632DB91|nr:hypothetical protein [uncultured Winogradskyella sp.]
MNEIKFFGVLQNYSLDILNKEIIEILLDKNVISKSTFQTEVNKSSIKAEESKSFEYSIFYDKTSYFISKEFYKELYYLLQFCVEKHLSGGYTLEINSLEHSLKGCLNKDSKIKYLEKKYSEIYNEDQLGFPEYMADDTNYYNWDTYFDVQIGNSNQFLIDYLTSKFQFISCLTDPDEIQIRDLDISNCLWEIILNNEHEELKEFLHEWSNCFDKKCILEYIKREIDNLKLNSHSKNKLSALEIAYYAYYMKEARESFTVEQFPSDAAHKELGERFNTNWTNIKKNYIEISTKKNLRLKATRRDKILNCKKFLKPSALNIANKEIKGIY